MSDFPVLWDILHSSVQGVAQRYGSVLEGPLLFFSLKFAPPPPHMYSPSVFHFPSQRNTFAFPILSHSGPQLKNQRIITPLRYHYPVRTITTKNENRILPPTIKPRPIPRPSPFFPSNSNPRQYFISPRSEISLHSRCYRQSGRQLKKNDRAPGHQTTPPSLLAFHLRSPAQPGTWSCGRLSSGSDSPRSSTGSAPRAPFDPYCPGVEFLNEAFRF